MHIRLGLHLDGQRGWHAANRLGFATIGPLGLLNVLETQLGLLRESASQSERIVQYRDCLKRCNHPDRFYHRTFATDELGTAATLLEWRDRWHLHSWKGNMAGASSIRLRDLGDVEKPAATLVAPSIGERLAQVCTAMERRKPAIAEVELIDPVEAFPQRWRDILARLPVKVADPIAAAAGQGFLGKLQGQLLKTRSGEKTKKIAWKDDGSVTVVRAETRFLAGRWLSDRLGRLEGDGLVVAPSEGAVLDGILAASDRSRQGFREASAFRPTLQLLPLVLEILWQPLNFYGLLQFLTHPICPVPGFARRKLAGKLAEKPGIGGEGWQKVLAEIDDHYGAKAKDVRASIGRWIEHPRFDQSSGAPVDFVLERVRTLTEFFRVRLADDDQAARAAYHAGFAQSQACAEALQGLLKQGVTSIRPRQLQQLVSQATARGTDNPLLVAEVGALMGVSDPAAAVEHFDHVLWWQLGMPAMPASYPWSQLEIAELAKVGVCLPSIAEALERVAREWLKPILAARKQLTLVLPPKGEEVHPIWLMIDALVDNLPIASLESVLTAPIDDRTRPLVPYVPLPNRRRWWQLPAGTPVPRKGRDSFSSLELFVFNPYQWLLKYPAALRPSRILDVSNNFRLFGNLAHGLVANYFAQAMPFALSDAAFLAWFDQNFERIVAEEGAVLLMPGRRSDLEGFRLRLRDSMRQLRHQLASAGVTQVTPEMALTGTYAGGEIVGYADLVVAKKTGEQAVVDMKWSGSKKFPEKLAQNRHLQLAIYAELLPKHGGTGPSVAYYILDKARLYATDANYFPDAQTVRKATPETTADLWKRFVETWKWRSAQMAAGRFEVVLEGLEETEDSVAPENALACEVLKEDYNEY